MEEIDLKEFFNMFWNKKVPIILIILLFAIIGSIYTMKFTTPKYSSSTTLVLASSEEEGIAKNATITTTDITINSKLVSTYSELVKSKNIVREVITNLGIEIDEERLKSEIKVTAVSNTELIKITVENENAVLASKIANEVAKVFTQKVKEIYNINNVQIVDEAEVSSNPSNINHVKDVIMAVGMGIAVAFLYVMLANMLDNTIKNEQDIEKEFNIPVLASMPMVEKLNEGRKYKR